MCMGPFTANMAEERKELSVTSLPCELYRLYHLVGYPQGKEACPTPDSHYNKVSVEDRDRYICAVTITAARNPPRGSAPLPHLHRTTNQITSYINK